MILFHSQTLLFPGVFCVNLWPVTFCVFLNASWNIAKISKILADWWLTLPNGAVLFWGQQQFYFILWLLSLCAWLYILHFLYISCWQESEQSLFGALSGAKGDKVECWHGRLCFSMFCRLCRGLWTLCQSWTLAVARDHHDQRMDSQLNTLKLFLCQVTCAVFTLSLYVCVSVCKCV